MKLRLRPDGEGWYIDLDLKYDTNSQGPGPYLQHKDKPWNIITRIVRTNRLYSAWFGDIHWGQYNFKNSTWSKRNWKRDQGLE